MVENLTKYTPCTVRGHVALFYITVIKR